jgi:hypothetical protein
MNPELEAKMRVLAKEHADSDFDPEESPVQHENCITDYCEGFRAAVELLQKGVISPSKGVSDEESAWKDELLERAVFIFRNIAGGTVIDGAIVSKFIADYESRKAGGK